MISTSLTPRTRIQGLRRLNRQKPFGQPRAAPPRVTYNDAIAFVAAVKVRLRGTDGKYERFHQILSDFLNQRVDQNEVIDRVKELLEGHRDLILGFNFFLPKGYEMRV